MRFLDVKTDYAFKKVFGSEAGNLLPLLDDQAIAAATGLLPDAVARLRRG